MLMSPPPIIHTTVASPRPRFALTFTLVCGLATACVDPGAGAEFDESSEAVPGTEATGPTSIEGAPSPEATPTKGEEVPASELPQLDAQDDARTFVQLLPKPTPNGQNLAVHVELPPPTNPELQDSLVRVLGERDNPLIMVRSDVLVELGRIPESPGPKFFTALVTLSDSEIERRKHAEDSFANFEGEVSDKRVVFSGRSPVALTQGLPLDLEKLLGGGLVALGPCPMMPTSELARWEESLVVTETDVVHDEDRTNDLCHPGNDNPDGVWTFKHLMEEMATGSGMSTHEFVVHWLENWINPDTVNGDNLPVRMNMVNLVVAPWAALDGLSVNIVTIGGRERLQFEDNFGNPAELDLDKAPFRLSAIVNRIDLGGTATGSGGYGGASNSVPTDAGELRFVFGVQNSNCGALPFSVIFEYGVPINGCNDTRDWAFEWTKLNDPSFATRFDDDWRDHLESLTESVVVHGAAPTKGNQNAINQVRTNENALNFQWEFREFTLSTETLTNNPTTDVDSPVNGPLRPHTVAQTPNDADTPGVIVFDATGDPTVDDFLFNVVLPGTSTTGVLPGPCSASYDLTGLHTDANNTTWQFRGGNAFTAPPTHWRGSMNFSDADEACARHQFSLNTCNGCHFDDTGTFFFHINPQTDPAQLSDFMTGGAGLGSVLHSVPDSQSGLVPDWTFNDLHRRFERLYEIACAACGGISVVSPTIVDLIAEQIGFAPIDPLIGKPPVPVGPITEFEQVKVVLELADELVDLDQKKHSVELDRLVRPTQRMVH